uniref:SUMF1/EgtB/PvdO family nonheme iron enzyme n=1 Tax=Thalassoglobus sp. TaxID=2795869 RepID=UPI003AA8928F
LEKEGLSTHVEEFTVNKDGKTALRAVVLNNKLDGLLNGEKAKVELPPPTNNSPVKNPTLLPSNEEFALQFDGLNDYVNADSVRTVPGQAFNFELWMRCEGQFKDIASDGLIHQFPASVGSALLTRRCGKDNLNQLYVTVKAADRQDRQDQSLFATYYSLQSPVHEWIHVYIQIDEQSVGHLYVNGKQSNESRIYYHGVKNQDELTQVLHDLWQEDFGLTLGAREFPDQGNQFRNEFQGSIREFRMSSGVRYSQDFTPEQHFSKDENTQVLYHFNEGAGDTLQDSSGNGHDGKIIGAKWVKTTSPTTSSPPPAIAPFDAAAAKAHQKAWADYLGLPVEKEVELPGGEKMVFMLIPPGEFLMGSTKDDQAIFQKESKSLELNSYYTRIFAENPQHLTRITQPFYLGKFEVTQIQWQSVMENNPGRYWQDESDPVHSVSWDDVQEFLTKVSAGTANETYQFVLPTEAQWELACRAGTTSYWHSGNRESDLHGTAWSQENSERKTHPVGQLAPNPFGLYDIHGNVFEWCSDWYAEETYSNSPVDDPSGSHTGEERVCRGGSWLNPAMAIRSAYRGKKPPSERLNFIGFRAAMSIDVTKLETSQIPPAGLHGSGDTLKDSSGNGQATSMATGPAIPLQSALEFNGKSRVTLPKTTWYENDEYTFEAFVRADAVYNEGDASQYIVNQHYTSALSLARGLWVFSVHRGEDNSVKKLSRTDQLADIGSWVHLAGVSRNGTIQLFVDGEPMEAEQFPENVKSGMGEGISLGDSFVGAIRQVKISKTAQYDERFDPPQQFSIDANTVALYKFDEGTGNTLKDSSGNGHHGKIIGAKWVDIAPKSTTSTTPASERFRIMADQDAVHGIAISPDNKLIASAGASGTVKIWDVATQKNLHVLTGHQGPVRSVAFSPDGSTLASGSDDLHVKIWDVATGKELLSIKDGWCFSVEFSPDGETLVASYCEGNTKLLNAKTGERI